MKIAIRIELGLKAGDRTNIRSINTKSSTGSDLKARGRFDISVS